MPAPGLHTCDEGVHSLVVAGDGNNASAGASYLRHEVANVRARNPTTVTMPAPGLHTCDKQ